MSQQNYLTNTLYVGIEKKHIEALKIWRPSAVGLLAQALGLPCLRTFSTCIVKTYWYRFDKY
jgi:hypothetical protein